MTDGDDHPPDDRPDAAANDRRAERDDGTDDRRGQSDAEDPLAWRTRSSETAYTCEGFDVVNETVELPDGTRTEFDYCAEGESVVVLPFTGSGGVDDEVVVIEEWRQAVDRVNRGFPAGSLEPGEDPATAARRELAEETGYEAGTVEHLVTLEPANGFADAVFHYFVATDCAPTAGQQLDDDESIRVDTTPFRAVLDAASEDRLRDGRAAQAACHYALFEA